MLDWITDKLARDAGFRDSVERKCREFFEQTLAEPFDSGKIEACLCRNSKIYASIRTFLSRLA